MLRVRGLGNAKKITESKNSTYRKTTRFICRFNLKRKHTERAKNGDEYVSRGEAIFCATRTTCSTTATCQRRLACVVNLQVTINC